MSINALAQVSIQSRIAFLWDTLTEPHPSVKGIVEYRQARLFSRLMLVFAPLSLVVIAIFPLLDPKTAITATSFAGSLVLFMIYGLSRTRYYQIGIRLVNLSIVASIVFPVINSTNPQDSTVLSYLIVPLLLASMLLSGTGLLISFVLLLVSIGLVPILSHGIINVTIPMTITIITYALLIIFIDHRNVLDRDRQSQLTAALEQSQADKDALAQSQSLLRSVIDNLPLSVSWKDHQSTFLGINEQFLRLTEIPVQDQVIGKKDHEISWINSAEIDMGDDQAVIASNMPSLNNEKLFTRSDGTQTWVSVSKAPMHMVDGTVSGVITIIQDISTRKMAEESQALLVSIIDHTTDFVSSADLDGHIVFLNPAGRKMIGLSEDVDVTTLMIPNFAPPSSLEILGKQAIPTAMRDGTWSGELGLLTQSGREIPVSQVLIIHKNPDGTPTNRLSIVVRDISERKMAEAQREKLIKDLQGAKRLAEENSRLKSEFLSTMSHELRTPLNAIEGFTGIIINKIGGTDYNEKTETYMTRIRFNSRRLLQLINDFLDLSRIEAGRLELASQPFSPERLAKRWQEEISVLAEKKGLLFDVSIDSALPATVYGDEEAISKIALNLLSNAIKFTEQGYVKLALESSNGTWGITIEDTGIGIPPHAREFIFEEFRQVDQTSKRKYGGTGLGLAIAQKYTRAMGGTVNVKSELGKGSTFIVSLPLKTIA